MKQFVNSPGAEKAVITLRSRLPGRIAWAGACAAGLVACGIAVQRSGVFKARAPQPTQMIVEPVRQQSVSLEKKKADSLQSFINVLVAKSVSAAAVAPPKIRSGPSKSPSRVSAPSIAPSPSPDERMIEELKTQYATSDLVGIFAGEVKAGHYPRASRIFPMLTNEQSHAKTATIFHMRLLNGLNDRDELKKVLFGAPLEDGEFYLEKARFFYNGHNLAQCLANLDLSLKTPSAFLDQVILRQEVLYCKALCYSAEFDEKPSQQALKKAMDFWFEVKFQYRLSPDHAHFQKAVSEMQRLGGESSKVKG